MTANLSQRWSVVSALWRDVRAVAAMEFAMALPLLIVLVSYGLELTNYALAKQRVSQLALHVADNASRIGAQTVLKNKPITESDINDLFIGAELQAGDLDLEENGRIIISSLELNATKGQWIHWQRCYGNKGYSSPFGKEGDGLIDNSFPGMGPPANPVKAVAGTAVMFVEVSYTYKPLVSSQWVPATDITDTAAFNVRDDRDLSAVYNIELVEIAKCLLK